MKFMVFTSRQACIDYMEERGWEYANEVFSYGEARIHISSAMKESNDSVLSALEHTETNKAWKRQRQENSNQQ